MTRLVVCMDCPDYQKGGYCTHKRKDVSALAPACEYAKTTYQKFNPENTEDMHTLSAKDYLETKTCSACGETKPLSEFYKDKKSSDGHKSQCKHCVSLDNAARARKARAEKKAQEPKPITPAVVVREKMTAQQMVDALRAEGWTVTCTRTITEEL